MAKQTKVNAPAVYILNPAALALAAQGMLAGNTLQRSAKGMGKGWRATGIQAPNTRAASLATLNAAYPSGFTAAQAQAHWVANTAGFSGHATPASRIKAFIANGYFSPTSA